MNYLFEGRPIYIADLIMDKASLEEVGTVRGDLLHVGERTFIVVEAEIECYSEEETDLYAMEFCEVYPESVELVAKVEE